LEAVEIMRPGYAIEYDFVDPIQLQPTLETKALAGLYHAGQINGTSGYEEAGAQGLLAGINAALGVQGRAPLVIGRDQGYLGVLVDDLVTLGAQEPYRMFTSRAEYRLLLREDNADQRLSELAYRVGLLPEARWQRYCAKLAALADGAARLREVRVAPGDQAALERLGLTLLNNGASLEELLRRPEIGLDDLLFLDAELAALPAAVRSELETAVKYAGYIRRQQDQVERTRRMETQLIPADFDYAGVAGLSAEVREKLQRVRPQTLGQAGRIPGMTPAAVAILAVLLRR
jgi:tRNA uridine 5-carboxymethylaminomethyl modification enzyme